MGLNRTPPVDAQTPVQQTVRAENTPINFAANAVADRQIKESTGKEGPFSRLGVEIGRLIEMLEDGKRRSIHQPMRDTIESIRSLYEQVVTTSLVDSAKNVLRGSKYSQTSPWPKEGGNAKRKAKPNADTPNPKRKLVMSTHCTGETGAIPKATPENNINELTAHNTDGKWTEVVKKGMQRYKPKAPRPEAIIIGKIGEATYSDILKKVKKDEKLRKLGEDVNKIRKTRTGEMILELKKSQDGNTNKYKEELTKVLGDQANVKLVGSEKTVVVKDLDEVTTKEEIVEAINGIAPNYKLTLDVVRSLRKGFAGTQVAMLSLPSKLAFDLINLGKIKVGWVVCRLRENTTPIRCFKCLEHGHIAKNCLSKVDRSKCCINCGKGGHTAKMCREKPECAICVTNGLDANHPTGGRQCPEYKKALAKLMK